MKSFAALLSEDLRLRILQLLEQAVGYGLNVAILGDALQSLGHRVSRDKLVAEVAWLEEQDLVTTEQVGNIIVATATTRGVDAARGATRVPGVKRPLPQ